MIYFNLLLSVQYNMFLHLCNEIKLLQCIVRFYMSYFTGDLLIFIFFLKSCFFQEPLEERYPGMGVNAMDFLQVCTILFSFLTQLLIQWSTREG